MVNLSLDPHLLIYAIIYLGNFGIMEIYFILQIFQYYFIYFVVPIILSSGHSLSSLN